MQGRGQRRPVAHALEGIAALVGELDALPGLRQGLAQLAAGLEKLAEVGGADGGVLPVLLGDALLQAQPHQPRGLRQPAQRPEREARIVQDTGLVRLAEPRREPLPGGIEEGREDGDLAAEGSELLRAEVRRRRAGCASSRPRRAPPGSSPPGTHAPPPHTAAPSPRRSPAAPSPSPSGARTAADAPPATPPAAPAGAAPRSARAPAGARRASRPSAPAARSPTSPSVATASFHALSPTPPAHP